MPIIGYANGAPVFDNEDGDEIETRTAHDPHSGQFTSGGGSSGKGGKAIAPYAQTAKQKSNRHSKYLAMANASSNASLTERTGFQTEAVKIREAVGEFVTDL